MKYEARRQDLKNRQNSVDDFDSETKSWFDSAQDEIWSLAFARYQEALDKGIAKECARFLLPLGTQTRLYMNGTIRSWIHYIELRTGHGTQLEHMQIAEGCKKVFCQQMPLIAEALGWTEEVRASIPEARA
jgi:thymidylate synthase (FAD)